MNARWAAAARVAAALGIGAGLVALVPILPASIQLRAPQEAQEVLASGGGAPAGATGPTSTPVRTTVLVCPGSETDGISGLPPVPPGVTTVFAASAPSEALVGVPTVADDGAVTLRVQPSGTELDTTSARGRAVTGTLSGPTTGELTAAGALAVGVAGLQTTLHASGDDRGLSVTSCQVPGAELWLLAGGGDSTRRERLIITNPGANAVTVDVSVHGSAGRISSVNGSRLAVPPHGRVGILVDAIAPSEPNPAVHVTASGGLVTAVLEDAWIEGAVARGRDDVGPSAEPSTDQVVPAAFLTGRGLVRLVSTGDDEAVAQIRVLTDAGAVPLSEGGVVRVPGGAVRDVDLGTLAAGAYAVQVKSDEPVVASVLAERRSADPAGPSDLAWSAAGAPIPVIAGTPVPPGVTGRLMLVGTGADWAATVLLVGADAVVTATSVTGQADSVKVLDLGSAAAVWVRPSAGTVRAGVAIEAAPTEGPLFGLLPLVPIPVTTTDVPVREIRR
ncbi:MAG: DUF5719 family protein [Candidatus Phosphoribacter sp.]|nr:hypothetical protein [Actinomycetales bacterium]